MQGFDSNQDLDGVGEQRGLDEQSPPNLIVVISEKHREGDHHHEGHLVDIDQGDLEEAVLLNKVTDGHDQGQDNLTVAADRFAVVFKVNLGDNHCDYNDW